MKTDTANPSARAISVSQLEADVAGQAPPIVIKAPGKTRPPRGGFEQTFERTEYTFLSRTTAISTPAGLLRDRYHWAIGELLHICCHDTAERGG